MIEHREHVLAVLANNGHQSATRAGRNGQTESLDMAAIGNQLRCSDEPTATDSSARPPLRSAGAPRDLASDEVALRHRMLILRLMRLRSLRDKFFAPGLFADPCWDILLDVMVHQLAGRTVSTSSVCLAAGVPMTTAMRRLQDLEETGLVRRVPDPEDGRRVLVEITDAAASRMARYLDLLQSAFTVDPMLDAEPSEPSDRR